MCVASYCVVSCLAQTTRGAYDGYIIVSDVPLPLPEVCILPGALGDQYLTQIYQNYNHTACLINDIHYFQTYEWLLTCEIRIVVNSTKLFNSAIMAV